MAANNAFRQALEDGDIRRLRRIWATQMPHLPLPKNREEAEITMHIARTASETVGFQFRAYSHAWLTERALPSHLPDNLKPQAERIYPRVAEGVGISMRTDKEWLKPALVIIRTAMSDAVEDCYANGDTDPVFIKARIAEVRKTMMHSLFAGIPK